MKNIVNAKIDSTSLGTEGHGIMTLFLHLSYDGSTAQSFGGYNLTNASALARWIKGIMDVVGVESWEDLSGKFIRVEMAPDQRIARIGNLLEDKWFDPKP